MLLFCAALYQELGEKGNEMENLEYQNKKVEDLQKRLNDARSSIHHIELVRGKIVLVHTLSLNRRHLGHLAKVINIFQALQTLFR